MLDVGLLVTGAVIVATVSLAARIVRGPAADRGEILDRLTLAVVAGLLGARAAAAALDDPTSLFRLRSFLVIRGGVEFWVGAALTTALLAAGARRRRAPVALELAELAPFLLWGYAAFEATCLVREGCYGPLSPVGLRPAGIQARMLPLGVVGGLALAALGVALHVLWRLRPWTTVLLAVAGVAAVRALTSVWLPRVSEGLTRQHRESLVVLAASAGIGFLLAGRHWLRGRRKPAAGRGGDRGRAGCEFRAPARRRAAGGGA